MWNGKTGHMMPGSPVVVEDYSFLTNQAIADISGDNYPEVIMGTGGYFVHAVDACGREAPGWPKFTGGWMTATPAVGDITGDGNLEVVEATRDGYLYAWTTKGTSKGVIQWESFHHDNANTGNYGTPLDQGKLEIATKVIDCTLSDTPDGGKMTTPDGGPPPKGDGGMTASDAGGDSGPTTPPEVSAGGCRCTMGSHATGEGAWIGLGVALLAFVRRRRPSATRRT
jgi:MYXO-CTERM domain-containing protein